MDVQLPVEAVDIPSVPVAWNRLWLSASHLRPRFEPWKDNRFVARIAAETYAELAAEGPSPVRVFVPTLALPRFIRRVLPTVAPSRRIILVTGLADAAPGATLRAADASGGLLAALLSDSRVLRWHAENLDVVDEKTHALPIGIDLHTLAWKAAARPHWGPAASPAAQALELAVAATSVVGPSGRRHADSRCYVHWGYVSPLRAAVSAALGGSAAAAIDASPPGTVPRAELWRRMASHRWVASVAGAGVDCHRTWEALALGCGVVVQDCSLTRALLGRAGVPVVFVPGFGAAAPADEAAEWASHVTQATLDEAWAAAGRGGGEAPDAPPGCGGADASVPPSPFSALPPVVLAETWLQELRRGCSDERLAGGALGGSLSRAPLVEQLRKA